MTKAKASRAEIEWTPRRFPDDPIPKNDAESVRF